MAIGTQTPGAAGDDVDREEPSAETAAHPFYEQLNQILDAARFDAHVETLCARLYAPTLDWVSLPPERYFHLLLVGYLDPYADRFGQRIQAAVQRSEGDEPGRGRGRGQGSVSLCHARSVGLY